MSAFIETDKLARTTSGDSVAVNKVGGGTVRIKGSYINRGVSTKLGVAVSKAGGGTVMVSRRAVGRRAHRTTIEVQTP